ncbi:MAG: carboxylesterase family protein [Novosphingobium sp.]
MTWKPRIAIAALFALSAAAPALAKPIPLVVRTESGPVRGVLDGPVQSWKGVPFAAPPVGPLRWRAPQPVTPWAPVRDASAYGHDCMQTPFPSDAAPLGTPPSEDCLYLNVWRPAAAHARLPVLLWIYGGGFVNGGSSPPTYSGAAMAARGVVFVSFNYRVGRFGTFAHPALTRADEDRGLRANYGTLDQIAALNWVRRNIARFGGDPANITVAGESAGGMSVHTLLTSPLTRGSVRRAIVMSGGDGVGMGAGTLAGAEETGAAFGESKGVRRDDPQALVKLRTLTAEQVTDGLNLAQLFGPGKRTFSSPFPDGRIAADVGAAYRSGRFNRVPVMIGATSADIGGPTGAMIAGARTLARVLAAQGVPVYAYRFSYVTSAVGSPGAQHATDIPFFFNTERIKYGAQTTTRDAAMGATIADAVARFARTGDPNGGGLPRWPRYDPASDTIMDFAADGTPAAIRDPLAPVR